MEEPYGRAILEVLLDTLEPNPEDRPSATTLLSNSIFSILVEVGDDPGDDAVVDT
jgi:hypothetical protein